MTDTSTLTTVERNALNAAGYIGCSDLSVILGTSPWRTPVQLQHAILKQVVTHESTMAMEFGQHNESFVARWYERSTGATLRRHKAMLRSDVVPHLVGHVDRLVVPKGEKLAAHRGTIRAEIGWEGKTHHHMLRSQYGDDWSDAIPDHEYIQVSGYMMLASIPRWHVSVLFGNTDLVTFEVMRDLELEALIVARTNQWWQRHIVDAVPCEPTNDDDVALLFPDVTRAKREASEYERGLVIAYDAARSLAKQVLEKKAEAALALKAAIASDGALTWEGREIASWRKSKPRGSFDLATMLGTLAPGAMESELRMLEADAKRTFIKRAPSGVRSLRVGESND